MKKSINHFTRIINNFTRTNSFPIISCKVYALHPYHSTKFISEMAFFILTTLSVVIIKTLSHNFHSSNVSSKLSAICWTVWEYLMWLTVKIISLSIKLELI